MNGILTNFRHLMSFVGQQKLERNSVKLSNRITKLKRKFLDFLRKENEPFFAYQTIDQVWVDSGAA